MAPSNAGDEMRATQQVRDDAARALDLFEATQDEKLSQKAEKETIEDAKKAIEIIDAAVEAQGGKPTKAEVHELKDMEKLIDAETRAGFDATKNDLYFEDRQLIKGEELAADAAERAYEAVHPDS